MPPSLPPPDLDIAAPPSLELGSSEPQTYSSRSFRSWRENSSTVFIPRPVLPPRSIGAIGRQECLSERAMTSIVDAANADAFVRSYDRQLFNPEKNNWQYVEGRDVSYSPRALKPRANFTTSQNRRASEVDFMRTPVHSVEPNREPTSSGRHWQNQDQYTTVRNSCEPLPRSSYADALEPECESPVDLSDDDISLVEQKQSLHGNAREQNRLAVLHPRHSDSSFSLSASAAPEGSFSLHGTVLSSDSQSQSALVHESSNDELVRPAGPAIVSGSNRPPISIITLESFTSTADRDHSFSLRALVGRLKLGVRGRNR
jgi:hypothetical protein